MRAALLTLKDLGANRKIAVLGDMLEIGEYAMEEHEKIGKFLIKIVDQLILVGPRAKFIALGAEKAGFPKKNIHVFDLESDAKAPVQELLRKGDLVLIKGSRAMRLDRVVTEIKSFPTASV